MLASFNCQWFDLCLVFVVLICNVSVQCKVETIPDIPCIVDTLPLADDLDPQQVNISILYSIMSGCQI